MKHIFTLYIGLSLLLLNACDMISGGDNATPGKVTVGGSGSTRTSTGSSTSSGSGDSESADIGFDNAATDMSSSTVQDALIEINSKTNGTRDDLDDTMTIVATNQNDINKLQNDVSALDNRVDQLESKNCIDNNTMTSINNTYCIDNAERGSAATWVNATNTCNNAGGRICDADQWEYACLNTATYTKLTKMTDNAEWTGTLHVNRFERYDASFGNYYPVYETGVSLLGKDGYTGSTGCAYGSAEAAFYSSSVKYTYRCCFNLIK